jgi:hypothetical protein
MNGNIQLDLFSPTRYQEFLAFMQTPAGREIANRFIRIAWGVRQRKKRIGAKAIWERLRWNYAMRSNGGDEEFKLNNNYTAYMARFAMQKEPRLQGMFDTREIRDNGTEKPERRAILVTLKDRKGIPLQ